MWSFVCVCVCVCVGVCVCVCVGVCVCVCVWVYFLQHLLCHFSFGQCKQASWEQFTSSTFSAYSFVSKAKKDNCLVSRNI